VKNADPLKIEIFNLRSDLGEKNDVAAENPQIVAKAREIMRRAHVPSKLFPLGPIDEMGKQN
jgi:hypothetical protein